MDRLTMENLPQDARESLPEDAQRLFMAAYNSALENTKSEDSAKRIAWQTIKQNASYRCDENGKWHRLPEADGDRSPLGNMTTA